MKRNNGFLSFFVFLIFLTYIFYLTYGFLKKRKEETNQINSTINIRKENFYNVPKEKEQNNNEQSIDPSAADPVEETAEENENTSEQPVQEVVPENNAGETANSNETKSENRVKAYIRVATYNNKSDADAALKKLDNNFKIRESKTSSGKVVYIMFSKTVNSEEELNVLKEKVKDYRYQIINQN